ncbi:MAG: alpha/beta hydrolase fold [uncultured Solirubrobacterales bacterium]|uniref:Alpha/beta hydrolase fold n=1 Tax=uncultured Solirubrobacterales bacterium TaxID=768556 RepID=A0A6J4SST0_9ACTN|nr:MAG: alpha/beta hydrolase fold [uncultured Solirubrobacterales bacterium]
MGPLAERYCVIAPDLRGHGQSARPRGDYSLGAHASGVRDLLVTLERERATFVGHSLGGGIVMQLAYQHPELCERMVLASSGGLGAEVHPLLRAASLPGSELVLPFLAGRGVRLAGTAVSRAFGRLGMRASTDVVEFARGYGSLSNRESREAFMHTLRAVIDPRGQRVSARDRLYLAAELPTLFVVGERDGIIPPHHGRSAQTDIPGSRLEILEASGHFPQLDEPDRFVAILDDFIATTKPADVSAEALRRRLQTGARGTNDERGS